MPGLTAMSIPAKDNPAWTIVAGSGMPDPYETAIDVGAGYASPDGVRKG